MLQSQMCGMKRDCGGAAAILGAFYATVKQVRANFSQFVKCHDIRMESSDQCDCRHSKNTCILP